MLEKHHPKSAEEINLQENFPKIKESLTLTEASEILGENYVGILEKAYQLPDTYGLCGLLAGHAVGIMCNPNYWKTVQYDPGELLDKAKSEGQTALKIFLSRFYQGAPTTRASDISITSGENLSEILDCLGSNQGLLISTMCQYPIHEGLDTHFLGCLNREGNDVFLAGDLSPYNLKGNGVIKVPISDVTNALNRVIGSKSTTEISHEVSRLKESEGRHNMRDKQGQIVMNACIWSGL